MKGHYLLLLFGALLAPAQTVVSTFGGSNLDSAKPFTTSVVIPQGAKTARLSYTVTFYFYGFTPDGR